MLKRENQWFQSLFYWIINSINIQNLRRKLQKTMFQSLFYWIINSIKKKKKLKKNKMKRFQSLFYWIINSIGINIFTTILILIVSILILLDYQFYHPLNYIARCNKERFQSLFYWIINSIKDVLNGRNSNVMVSILILLDYQFYPVWYENNSYDFSCFNPYSTGLSILSTENWYPSFDAINVSILILLDYQFYQI